MRGFPKANMCFSCIRPEHQIHSLQGTEPVQQTFVKACIKPSWSTYKVCNQQPFSSAALCFMLAFFSPRYYSLRCPTFSSCILLSAVGIKLSPADTFCCLSATEFGCDIIPGNVNLIWDKALHGWLGLLFNQISVSLQDIAVLLGFFV